MNRHSEILYDYTDNAGLVGILTSGELWFSDAEFLNDAQELKVALKVGNDTIHDRAEHHRQRWIAKCPESQFNQMVQNICDTMLRNSHPWERTLPPRPFIFSMTRNHNDLSQWRAYGKSRYCIGFDRAMLESQIPNAQLVPVEYPADVCLDRTVSDRLDRFFTNCLDAIRDDGSIHDETVLDSASEFFTYPDRLYNAAFLARYKHFGLRRKMKYV